MTGKNRNHAWGCVLAAGLMLAGLGGCSDDDNSGDNNTNGNVNTNDNTNTGECTGGMTRCTGSVLETCGAGSWGAAIDCTDAGQVCRADTATGADTCEDLAWVWREVEIVDPVMNGSSLVTPVDGITFAYDAATDTYVTGMGWDINDPSLSHLWRVDGTDGTHAKASLTGSTLGATDGFCMGSEDWCQYVGFDPVSSEWVVLGISTSNVMRVSGSWVATLDPTSGTRPPDSWVNHSHRFAWTARQLFFYGATGSGMFGDTLYAYDLDSDAWGSAASGLPQITDNCLAYDSTNDRVLSVGGRFPIDGGNDSQTVDTLLTIDPVNGTHTSATLPAAIGARRAMSCVYDATRHALYVYGGSVVVDPWDEILNEHHNDLWVLDLAQMSWTELIPDTPSGTFNDPDQYGDQRFVGFPEGPNLGQNRGHMILDSDSDRLLIVGAVPIFTHEQLYWLRLEAVDQLL